MCNIVSGGRFALRFPSPPPNVDAFNDKGTSTLRASVFCLTGGSSTNEL